MALPVAIYDYAYEKLGLSQSFLEARVEKAKFWVPETQNMVLRINNRESFAIVAYTGGGKTVMGEWAVIDTGKRTLFVLPKRRLSKRQQRLFVAMGGKLQTRVIIGETPSSQRIWDNIEDRIIFATGHVIVEELKKNPDLLSGFELIIFDEFHHAATQTHSYSKVALIAEQLKIPRVGLSASPGNNDEKIARTLRNCRLDKKYDIDIPVARQVGSLVYAEEAEVYKKGAQRFLEEDIIGTEVRRSIYNLNYYSQQRTGVSANINPQKTLNYFQIKRIRDGILNLFPPIKDNENFNLFNNSGAAGFLLSLLREVEVWSHILELAKKESFQAIERYYREKIMKDPAAYAQRMIKRGRVEQVMEIIGKSLHPKLQLMQVVMESLVLRRGMQVLIFVDNIATAKATKELLENSNIKSALFFGSKHMKASEQEEALELLEDRKVNCLIATSVAKEGYDFEVDAVLCMGSPKNVIDFIQGSGRAGRHEKDAEIIYIATQKERRKILSLDKAVLKLKLAKLSQFTGRIPEQSISEGDLPPPEEPSIQNEEDKYLPQSRVVYQPTLF